MKKDDTVFLTHILESITAIEEYVQNVSEDEFFRSREKQDAVIRRLEIVGEAVNNLSDEFRSAHPDINWSKAIGTRNILIHHYFGVDAAVVWDTIQKSLPEMKLQVQRLLYS